MQQFKEKFIDINYKGVTISNIQPCIRLNDIDEISDKTHFLYFNMIGLFSFRSLTVKETIDFWMKFLQEKLELKIDYVTIHPDKFEDWKGFYNEYNVEVRKDEGCIWSDGKLGGYCTEFYIDDIEIGNIVNCNGDCIDVGFGLERLDMIVNKSSDKNEIKVLKETIYKIIESGYVPGPKKQGYILRTLLRKLMKHGEEIDHVFFKDEKERQVKILIRYNKLKDKHKDKDNTWWYETHGIDLNLI